MKTKNIKHRSKGGKKKTKNTNPAKAKPIKAAASPPTRHREPSADRKIRSNV
jgi:hypothetical protein